MLKGDAFRQMVMSWLETGWHPMMAFTVSLWMRNQTLCSCLSSLPLKQSLWPSWVDVFTKFYQRTSQGPRMFHQYLFISCVSSSSFPAALSDLTVPIVMLFLVCNAFVPSVAFFSPLSWWPAMEDVVLVPGDNRTSMDWDVVVIFMQVSWAILHGGAHPYFIYQRAFLTIYNTPVQTYHRHLYAILLTMHNTPVCSPC